MQQTAKQCCNLPRQTSSLIKLVAGINSFGINALFGMG